MKIKELIKQLKKMDQELVCYLQRDPEGNGYSPLEGIDLSVYYDEECPSFDNTHEDVGISEEKWEKLKKTSKCLCLYPGD